MRLAIASLTGVLLIAAALVFVGRSKRADVAATGRAPPRLSRSFLAVLAIVMVYAIWLLNSTSTALIMETLKGKLYRIDPGVKVFRCKFRTAPGKQFDVRAQALKRLEAALGKMGVGFADGTQTVLMPSGPAAPA